MSPMLWYAYCHDDFRSSGSSIVAPSYVDFGYSTGNTAPSASSGSTIEGVSGRSVPSSVHSVVGAGGSVPVVSSNVGLDGVVSGVLGVTVGSTGASVAARGSWWACAPRRPPAVPGHWVALVTVSPLARSGRESRNYHVNFGSGTGPDVYVGGTTSGVSSVVGAWSVGCEWCDPSDCETETDWCVVWADDSCGVTGWSDPVSVEVSVEESVVMWLDDSDMSESTAYV